MCSNAKVSVFTNYTEFPQHCMSPYLDVLCVCVCVLEEKLLIGFAPPDEIN
jgi:hypothetical protein